MKKTFLLIAALLLMGGTTFAGGGFDLAIGPKVGYQTTKLSYKRADIKDGFANHFTVGAFARVTKGRFIFQPEVLWFKTSNMFTTEVTGTNANNPLDIPTGADLNVTLNAMNLQVPVLIGFELLDLDIITLRAHAGPTANFVLRSQTVVDYSLNNNITEVEKIPENDNFDPKTITWGLQAGVGVDLLNKITLDVNYNFGMSKVLNALDDTALGELFQNTNVDDTKQNIFMVTVGLKLL